MKAELLSWMISLYGYFPDVFDCLVHSEKVYFNFVCVCVAYSYEKPWIYAWMLLIMRSLAVCMTLGLCFIVFKVIIKDTSLVLTPANIKAYILMTLQGLEYMHQHWVLHRVRKLVCSIYT